MGENLRMEVHDEAGGIPESEYSQVFTWFSKISVKPTGGEASHGLGLAICKDIIQAHEGNIGFNSIYGKGSVFYFEIKAFPKKANDANAA
jgi:K+-sensing histidine kinase KdpD